MDKGHCKMAYDDSEDPAELLHFYDFEPLQEAAHTTVSSSNELVLQSGHRLGHRHDLKFFKQRLRRNNVSCSQRFMRNNTCPLNTMITNH